MNRRRYLQTVAAVGAAAATGVSKAAAANPIQLHCDLDCDPKRQKEMIQNFERIFRPVIVKQPGFVAVKLLKLRSVVVEPGPVSANYRLTISFDTEEQRLTWVATADHQRVWPEVEKCLRGKKFSAVLYDPVA